MGFFDKILKPVLGGAAGFLVSGGNPIGAIMGAGLGASMNATDAQTEAARNASNTQMQSAREANALQKYMYDTTRADTQPFRDIELQGANIGINAMDQLYDKAMAGPGDFKASDAYKWNLSQGINALDKSAVAGGRSRNADTMRFASGLASNEQDNFLRRYYDSLNPLQSLARVQTGYNNALNSAGQNYAGNSGTNLRYAGDAAAQGLLAGGQAEAQKWNMLGAAPMNAMAAYNMYQQPNQVPYSYGNALGYAAAPTGPFHMGQFKTTAYGM